MYKYIVHNLRCLSVNMLSKCLIMTVYGIM